jgi:ABC-2 type transport system permease protein
MTSGLQQVLFLMPGYVEPAPNAETTFTPLVRTNDAGGTVNYDEMVQMTFLGPGGLNPKRRHIPGNRPYVVAARIQGPAAAPEAPAEMPGGELAPPQEPGPEPSGETAGGGGSEDGRDHRGIDVVIVADIDFLYPVFFTLRARGREAQSPVFFDLDNVTFVLNVLDVLAGDERFVDLRGRRPAHRTLSAVENETERAREEAAAQREAFNDEFEEKRAQEQKNLDDRIAQLQARPDIDPQQMLLEVAAAQEVGQNRLRTALERLERERDTAIERIETDLALTIRRVQDRYKLLAVTLPPIPPLLIGAIVLIRRKAHELHGVAATRLR